MRSILFAGISALSILGQSVLAQEIIETHAISTFGTVVYSDPNFAHLNYVNPDAPKGGTFTTWMIGGFDNLNPYATQEGRPALYSSIPFESILTGTLDDVDGSYCYLCTTMEYPEDKAWVIFNLRNDVTFSDGSPLTASDVVFTYDLFMEQATESYRKSVKKRIPLAEVIDDYTVKFTFAPDAPKNGLIETAGGLPIMSQKWFAETGARLDESRLETGVGSGAYMVGSFDVNQSITYVRNPNFWGVGHPLKIGHDNFDEITIDYFADTSAAFEGFKGGQYHFRQENSSISWATNYDFPNVQNGSVVVKTLPRGGVPSAAGFVFNMQKDKFQDRRVREAVSLMYNFTWTNDNLQYGLFKQRESFWQNSKLAAQGVAQGREQEILQGVADLIPAEILTDSVVRPHSSGDRQLDRKNLRRALALLQEAGWQPDANGKLTKNGQVLTLEILGNSPTFDRILLPFVDNLQRLGIDASWNRIDPAQYVERTRSFDFDMIYDSYRNGEIEGSGLVQRYGSDGLGDVFNPAYYANPAVDQIIEIVKAAQTHDEMAAGVRAIDRIMRHDLFMIPTWYLADYWVAYYDIYDHPENLPPYGLGETSIWWYDAQNAEKLRAAGILK